MYEPGYAKRKGRHRRKVEVPPVQAADHGPILGPLVETPVHVHPNRADKGQDAKTNHREDQVEIPNLRRRKQGGHNLQGDNSKQGLQGPAKNYD